MIRSFRDEALERCWREGRCEKIRPDLRRRVLAKLDMMDAVRAIDDLRAPPGNRLHALKGDWSGFWAIAVSGPWRLVFRFRDGDIHDIALEQYH
jgi:proteic killer suppression protein